MYLMFGPTATLAVAVIYWLWRTWFSVYLQRERTLRERVAYLLWVVAEHPA